MDFFAVGECCFHQGGTSWQQGAMAMTKVIQNEDVVTAIEEQFCDRPADVAGTTGDQKFQRIPRLALYAIFAEIGTRVRGSQIFGILWNYNQNSNGMLVIDSMP